MRNTLLVFVFICFSCCTQAADNQYIFSLEQQSQLHSLFTKLKQVKNENEALVIAGGIWHIWFNPDNEELRSRMSLAMTSLKEADFANAKDILDKIVKRWPQYPEARNQLAVLYFLKQDYEQSLIQVAETLVIEPRHFGALAGRGVIRIRQGKGALGFQSIIEAMKIYPLIPERHLLPPEYRNQTPKNQKSI